jgi:predicted aspartyl protease
VARRARLRHLAGLLSRRAIIANVVNLGLGVGAAVLLRDQVFWRAPEPLIADGRTEWLDFAIPRYATVTVPATVNGVEVMALVDSGAQRSVIDHDLARQLGLGGADILSVPLLAYGVGGKPQVGEAVTLQVEVGGMRLEKLRAASLQLGPVADGGSGASLPLILGQDMLSTVILEVDFPGRRLRFLPREGYAPPPEATPAPVRRQGRALMAEISIEGVDLEVMVDTGASAPLVLSDKVAEGAGLLARPVRTSRTVVLGGEMQGRAVTAGTLRFGDATLENVEVHIFEAPRLPVMPSGLLGYGAFRGFRVIFDHGGGRMFLTP